MKEIKKKIRKRIGLGIGIIVCVFSVIAFLIINNDQTKKESSKKENVVSLKQKEELTMDNEQDKRDIIHSQDKSKTNNVKSQDVTTDQNKVSKAKDSKSQSSTNSKTIKSDNSEKKSKNNVNTTIEEKEENEQTSPKDNTQKQTENKEEESTKIDKPITDNSESEVTWTMTAEEMKNYARSYIESRGFLYEENGTGYNNPITIYKGYSQDKIKGRIKDAIDYLVDIDRLDPESSAIGCIIEKGTDFYKIKIVY